MSCILLRLNKSHHSFFTVTLTVFIDYDYFSLESSCFFTVMPAPPVLQIRVSKNYCWVFFRGGSSYSPPHPSFCSVGLEMKAMQPRFCKSGTAEGLPFLLCGFFFFSMLHSYSISSAKKNWVFDSWCRQLGRIFCILVTVPACSKIMLEWGDALKKAQPLPLNNYSSHKR